MKQCFLAFRPHILGSNGANPLHNPSLKNKKAVNETPVREHLSLWLTRYPKGVGISLTALSHWFSHLAGKL
jgi:hypothetical protein